MNQQIAFGQIEIEDNDINSILVESDVIVGIGNPEIRHYIFNRIRENPKLRFPNLVDPSVEIDENSTNLGIGDITTKSVAIYCRVTIHDVNLLS